MTHNVENWQYKSSAEVIALSNELLLKSYKDLTGAIKLFHDHQVPLTDEMFWQFMVIGGEVFRRGLKEANK